MPRFTADTPEISAAGARLAGLSDPLAGARSAMARLEPAGHAADHPGVAGAIAAFAGAWTGIVDEMAAGASGLATNTGAAAENAGGPHPGDVLPGDLAWVASGEAPPEAPGGAPPPDPSELRLRAPTAEPDPLLVEALRAGLDGIDAVRELYLVEDGRTGAPVVGMLVEPRSEAAAAAAVLGELVRPHVPPGAPLDLVVLDGARRAELAELVDPIG